MKAIVCMRCGASRWKEEGNFRICLYCGTKYEIQSIRQNNSGIYERGSQPVSLRRNVESVISIGNDVEKLLEKCRTDPTNAIKYANLILDIDPTNVEALYYTVGRKRR